MAARRWLLAAVLLALACAQALGFMHRVAHVPALAGAGPAVHAHGGGGGSRADWLDALFAHTDDHGCRLFDGAGSCAVPPHAGAATPPVAVSATVVPRLAAAFVEHAPAAFQARAPPAFR